ncbi:hypothetical protein JHK87_048092 [Glycine soja]|nr:hypothetical protein JHK87_048092 [Glycine soja]
MNTMVRIGGVITKRSGVFPPIAAGEDVVEPNTAEMLATFVVDNHFKSQDVHILPQELSKKYITFAKLNISPRLDDLKMVKDELSETYAELQRKSSSFRKYVTFKKNYNDLLLYILCELVQNALLSEEIVTGFASGLTYLDVKVDNLYNKVLTFAL